MDLCTETQDLDLLVKELRRRVTETELAGSIVPRTDSEFLARFIRVKDYDIEEAFTNVKKYYECIHKHMDFLEGLRPSDYAYVYDSNAYLVSRHRFNGVLAILFRIGQWDPKEYSVLDCEKASVFAFEEYLSHVEVQEKGVSLILDYKGLRLEHLWELTIKQIQRCAEFSMYGFPMRVHSIHILRPPSIFWPAFYLVKKFMKQEIINRIHFHADFESLHQHFNKEFLPDYFGGELTEEQAAETCIAEKIKSEDIPFEEYWNGAIWMDKEKTSVPEVYKENLI